MTSKMLLDFALQIAKGMSHLAAFKVCQYLLEFWDDGERVELFDAAFIFLHLLFNSFASRFLETTLRYSL